MSVVGLLLACAALIAAIVWRFPYWYTPFTIGSFLFFDRLSERFAGRSVLRYLANGHWRTGVLLYFVAAGVAIVVDVVYGRALAGAWVYPPWRGIANIAVPVLFHYPFGFLSLYATFQTVRGLFGAQGIGPNEDPVRESRGLSLYATFQTVRGLFRAAGRESRRAPVQPDHRAPGKASPGHPASSGDRYGRLSLVALAFCLAVPPLNFWFNANRGEGELIFFVMLVSTVAFDGIRDGLTGDSMLRELGAYGWRYAAAVVITLAWAILVNEGPNVFAREWVYLTSPFGLPLWLELVLGWPFLLAVSASVYETTIDLTSRELGYTGPGGKLKP